MPTKLLKVFHVEPIGKPRMTRRDIWKKRPVVLRYHDFKDRLREQRAGFVMPECNYHVVFHISMPRSWSKKKKTAMRGTPHQNTPDKDNLEKALLDALEVNDAYIFDGRVTKLWAEDGHIAIWETESYLL